MKKSRIIDIFKFLNAIKINKVSDKDVRSAIISNHLQMYKIVQDHDEEVKELQKRLFEGKEKDINLLTSLREQYNKEKEDDKKAEIITKITSDCKEILSLELDFNNTLLERLNDEKPLNLKKVSQEKFVDACIEADVDITSGDLLVLTDLFVESNE